MDSNPTESPPMAAALRWLPVWQRNFRVWTKLIGPAILANFGEPLLYLLALGYGLGSFVGDMQDVPYVVFLASGIVCSSAMTTASFEGMYSAYTRMDVQRTWDAMLAAPLGVRDVIIGEVIWAGTKSLISAAAILLVALFLGAVGSWQAVLALPVVLLAGFCFASMALVVTAFAKNYDFFMYYNTLILTPMLLMGGVFFPLERMPAAIQWGAQLLPLKHAVDLVRPLVIGTAPAQPLWSLVILVGYTVVSLMIAIILIRRRLAG